MSLAENAKKIGWNCFYSIVPHPFYLDLRHFQDEFAQPNPWGVIRDYMFLCVQTTLVAAMGSLGGLVVLFQLGKTTFKAAWDTRDQRLFWLAFILICTFGTIATLPTLGRFGGAHACSQPLVYLGITFLAAGFFILPRRLRYIVICGSIIDFLLGIFLHFSLQHITIQLIAARGSIIVAPSMDLLNQTAVGNNLMKLSRNYTFWGDHFGSSPVVLQVTTAILFDILLYLLLCTALAARTRVGRLPAIMIGVLAVPTLLIAFYMVYSQLSIDQASAKPQTIITSSLTIRDCPSLSSSRPSRCSYSGVTGRISPAS
jgi:hypothetical protein